MLHNFEFLAAGEISTRTGGVRRAISALLTLSFSSQMKSGTSPSFLILAVRIPVYKFSSRCKLKAAKISSLLRAKIFDGKS